MPTQIDRDLVRCLSENEITFVTSVPCKNLSGLIELVDDRPEFMHVPSNKEDEGMGLCAGAYMGGRRAAILMQNTALGVVVNALATLIQFYRIPLPMIISYRGEVGEKVACQAEMAVHTKAILSQLSIPTYHFTGGTDPNDLDGILKHCLMCKKPVAVLADARFWEQAI